MAVAMKNGRAPMPAKKPVKTDTYSRRVSARLRELRDDRGWLVADLAERINRHLDEDDQLANSTVHGWDNGSRKIDPDFYPLLAKVFGLRVLDFLPAK